MDEVQYGWGEQRLGCLLLRPGDSPGKWKAELSRDPCFLHPWAHGVAGRSCIVAAVEGLRLSCQSRWQRTGIFHRNGFQLIKSECSGKSDFYSPLYFPRKLQFSWNILIFSQRNSNWSRAFLIRSKWIRLYMVEVQRLVGILLIFPLTLAFSVYLAHAVSCETQQSLFNPTVPWVDVIHISLRALNLGQRKIAMFWVFWHPLFWILGEEDLPSILTMLLGVYIHLDLQHWNKEFY